MGHGFQRRPSARRWHHHQPFHSGPGFLERLADCGRRFAQPLAYRRCRHRRHRHCQPSRILPGDSRSEVVRGWVGGNIYIPMVHRTSRRCFPTRPGCYNRHDPHPSDQNHHFLLGKSRKFLGDCGQRGGGGFKTSGGRTLSQDGGFQLRQRSYREGRFRRLGFHRQQSQPFRKTDGSLWGMGSNDFYGQLGFGTLRWVSPPARIADGFVAISIGDYHSLFITSDGTLWSMGSNVDGQLGYGATDSGWSNPNHFAFSFGWSPPPRIVAANVATAAAGTSHSLWTTTDGSLWSSGANSDNQLCTTRTITRKPPAKVQDHTGHTAAGGNNSVILTTNSEVEPPAIVIHPVSIVGPSVNAATFSVTATGAAAVYQRVSTPLPHATPERHRSRRRNFGRSQWLLVLRKTLSCTIPSRFVPALPLFPFIGFNLVRKPVAGARGPCWKRRAWI